MKDVMEHAPFLEMTPGMDAKVKAKYIQKFVYAPMSQHPPKHPGVMDPVRAASAMKITMGC